MKRVIVITGVSSLNSLGFKICSNLKKIKNDFHIIAICNINEKNENINDINKTKGAEIDEIYLCDLTDDEMTKEIFHDIKNRNKKIYALINCAGLNGNYWFEEMKINDWDKIMSVNSKSIYLTTQTLLESISRAEGTVLNIVSNAAHVPMRCSTAYNASKAAAKMITIQLARELTRKFNITVFSVSPNKLKGTEMSKYVDGQIPKVRGWTPDFSKNYQLDALITGEETDPNTLAEFISFLMSEKQRHFYLSGCDMPYGA